MEIEQLRKELNHLLDNVVEHSTKFSDERPIPSLEINVVLAKINKMQETLAVLKHLLEKQEKKIKKVSNSINESSPAEIVMEKEEVKVEEIVPPITTATKTIEDSLKQKPITKLMDAFSLNDRYLFANELFNKDMNAFNELIKSIDNSSTLDEAKEILSKLELDYENEQVLSFLNLVEHRFN